MFDFSCIYYILLIVLQRLKIRGKQVLHFWCTLIYMCYMLYCISVVWCLSLYNHLTSQRLHLPPHPQVFMPLAFVPQPLLLISCSWWLVIQLPTSWLCANPTTPLLTSAASRTLMSWRISAQEQTSQPSIRAGEEEETDVLCLTWWHEGEGGFHWTKGMMTTPGLTYPPCLTLCGPINERYGGDEEVKTAVRTSTATATTGSSELGFRKLENVPSLVALTLLLKEVVTLLCSSECNLLCMILSFFLHNKTNHIAFLIHPHPRFSVSHDQRSHIWCVRWKNSCSCCLTVLMKQIM